MAKRGRPKGLGKKPSAGEQLELIEVGPENIEEIAVHARRYKEAMNERLKALKVEVAEKQKILELVKKADLQRLKNGDIRFRCAGMVVLITPRDEVIKIIKASETKAEEKTAKKDKSMQKTVAETEEQAPAASGAK